MWMVEDILLDLASASGAQIEVSSEGASYARVWQYIDVGRPL